MRIRLVKKLAEVLNDVDLTDRTVGQVFDCPEHDARMLLLEGWAESVGATRVDSPDLSTTGNGSFENAQVSQSVWQVIEVHREGKKDKLA